MKTHSIDIKSALTSFTNLCKDISTEKNAKTVKVETLLMTSLLRHRFLWECWESSGNESSTKRLLQLWGLQNQSEKLLGHFSHHIIQMFKEQHDDFSSRKRFCSHDSLTYLQIREDFLLTIFIISPSFSLINWNCINLRMIEDSKIEINSFIVWSWDDFVLYRQARVAGEISNKKN